jgi:hypothetical protein
MSHPDPLFDPDNSYEDDDMIVEHDPSDILFAEYLYDGHEDENWWTDRAMDDADEYDDSMDGDHDSAMESVGWGTDEDYGYYGDDTPMYEDYYGGE